jgi:hypothetical protein
MNDFIGITSSGGYIGRLVWANTGSSFAQGWGSCGFYPVTVLGAWAEAIPLVRKLVTWH